MEVKKEMVPLRTSKEQKRENALAKLETFDVKLTASLGNIMYFIFLEYPEDIAITNGTNIKRCTVNGIMYDTGKPVYLQAITEEGRVLTGVQELFFTSEEEAKKALEIIRRIGMSVEYEDIEFEDYIKEANIQYRYILKFPMEPDDIILEDDSHYMAEGIHAEITFEIPEVYCYGKNTHRYKAGKRVLPIREIMSRPLFEIKKL